MDAGVDGEEDRRRDEAAMARCDREAAESTEAILGTLSASARAALAKAEGSVVLVEYDRGEYESARYTPSSERETSARREAEHHMHLRVDAEASSARAEEAAEETEEAEAVEEVEGLESTLSTLSAGAREALARVMAAEGND